MALGRGKMMAAIAVALCLAATGAVANLQVGFYSYSCPKAESLVKEALEDALEEDAGIGADLLRMHFHDCFVRGCDGSILLDGSNTEKTATVNKEIEDEAFQVVDKAKAKVEAACKGIVSCADILAFLARDSVAHYGGGSYSVPAGRRDGRVSRASETSILPGSELKLGQLDAVFAKKGLSQDDVVILSGAHTIGVAHCDSFSDRLYNFSTSTGVDPTLDPTYAAQLKQTCPASGNDDAEIQMDPGTGTENRFDNSYYQRLLKHEGLFTSDQTLLSTPATAKKVQLFASNAAVFKSMFAASMIKMGNIGVLTGSNGEIRANCRMAN